MKIRKSTTPLVGAAVEELLRFALVKRDDLKYHPDLDNHDYFELEDGRIVKVYLIPANTPPLFLPEANLFIWDIHKNDTIIVASNSKLRNSEEFKLLLPAGAYEIDEELEGDALAEFNRTHQPWEPANVAAATNPLRLWKSSERLVAGKLVYNGDTLEHSVPGLHLRYSFKNEAAAEAWLDWCVYVRALRPNRGIHILADITTRRPDWFADLPKWKHILAGLHGCPEERLDGSLQSLSLLDQQAGAILDRQTDATPVFACYLGYFFEVLRVYWDGVLFMEQDSAEPEIWWPALKKQVGQTVGRQVVGELYKAVFDEREGLSLYDIACEHTTLFPLYL